MAKDAKGHGSDAHGGGLAGGYARFGEAMAGLQRDVAHRVSDDRAAAKELAAGSQKSGPVPTHPGTPGGLGRGLQVDWSKAPNPHTGGGFAANARYKRNKRAAEYVEKRSARPSNFRLK